MAKNARFSKHANGDGSLTRIAVQDTTGANLVPDVIRVEIRQVYANLAAAEKTALRAITIGNIVDATPETDTTV